MFILKAGYLSNTLHLKNLQQIHDHKNSPLNFHSPFTTVKIQK